jgi:hypothetical protein
MKFVKTMSLILCTLYDVCHNICTTETEVGGKRKELQMIMQLCSLQNTATPTVFIGEIPLIKALRQKPIPHLNHDPRVPAKLCIL